MYNKVPLILSLAIHTCTLSAKAIEAMVEKAETDDLRPSEDAVFGLGGMGLMAIIRIFILNGTFRDREKRLC
jgi:hypothetical protein